MRVAVTGASGYVGRFIVAELLARGAEVRAWAREGTDRGGFSGPIEWIEGGLRQPETFDPLVRGIDAVVHAAFEHVPGRYRGGEGDDLAGFLDANLGGTLGLMRRAREAGAGRFVFLSSRAVYGRRLPDRALDEDHPALPDTHYGAAKAAVEAFVAAWGAEGWGVTALRPTGVYGLAQPLARSKWHALVEAIVAGEPLPGQPRGGTEVHGRDVARAVWLLLTAPGVAGRVFNCSDLYVTTRDVAAIARRLSDREGDLPDPPPVGPVNVMETGRLRALGLEYGGEALLERTVAGLVEAVRADRSVRP